MTKNAKISLKLLELVGKFQQKMTIQFAFYRNQKKTISEKITFNRPNQKLIIDNPPLSIFSTLQQKSKTGKFQQQFQQKIFNLQIVYTVDSFGKKQKISQIDVSKSYNHQKEIHQLILHEDSPQLKLKYQVSIQIQTKPIKQRKPQMQIQKPVKGQTQKKQLQKAKSQKSIKMIRFQRQDQKQVRFQRQDYKQGVVKTQRQRQTNHQISFSKDKFKSSSNTQRKIQQPLLLQFAKQTPSSNNLVSNDKKFMNQLQNTNKRLKNQLQQSNNTKKQLQTKLKDISQKYKKLKQNFGDLQRRYEQALKNKGEKTNQRQGSIEQIEKEKKKIMGEHNFRLNQLQSKIQKYQAEKETSFNSIKKLKQQVKNAQKINKELVQKLKASQNKSIALSAQNSNNSPDLQTSIKPYKDRLKSVELQLTKIQQQKNQFQIQVKNLSEQVGDLRAKIKSLNQQNLNLIEKNQQKGYQNQKLQKSIQELTHQMKQLQVNNSELNRSPFSTKSQKHIGGDNETTSSMRAQVSQLRVKLSICQKNLQNKEQLLKRFNQFSKQGEKQKENQFQKLKIQNKRLQEELQKVQDRDMMGQTGGLQAKVNLQKVKKELQIKIKNQRSLLIQKSQLQSRNKILQQDIVKCKESVANMLNVVQEFGDDDLIADVMSYL